jgi:hypothetical protein
VFPPRRFGFEPGPGHAGYAVDKVAPGQVFSECFGFPCQLFHLSLHTHHFRVWYNRPVVVSVKMDSVAQYPKRGKKSASVRISFFWDVMLYSLVAVP